MKFLICYSSRLDIRKDLPLAGTIVEIISIDDLQEFVKMVGNDVILHQPDWQPSLAEYSYLHDADERLDDHRDILPDGWETMPWLEVYNGYRE